MSPEPSRRRFRRRAFAPRCKFARHCSRRRFRASKAGRRGGTCHCRRHENYCCGRLSRGRCHGQAPLFRPGAAVDLDVGPFDGQSLRRVGAAVSRKIHFAYCEASPRQLSRVNTRAKTLAPLREARNVTALFGAAFAIARATKSH